MSKNRAKYLDLRLPQKIYDLESLLSQRAFLNYQWDLGFQNYDRRSSYFCLVSFVHSYCLPSQTRKRREAKTRVKKLMWAVRQEYSFSWGLRWDHLTSPRCPLLFLSLFFLTSDLRNLPRHLLKLRKPQTERRKENFTPTLQEL